MSVDSLWNGSKSAEAFRILLMVFMFLVTFTPSEAFLVPFLTRVKSFAPQQVGIDIFPYGIYSTLVSTLLAAPVCHFLSHRAAIIMGTFSKLATFVILYYGESLFIIRLSQVTYGIGMASNLVFTSYIFLLVAEEDYQVMTSYTQASSLVSFLMAAELGQFLVNEGVSLMILLQITLSSVALACIVSFLLPGDASQSHRWGLNSKAVAAPQEVWEVIRQTWQGENLRLLSFWWIFGTVGFALVVNYGTTLFDTIDPAATTYGHIIAASQAAGSLGALAGVKVSTLAAEAGGTVYVVGTFISGLLCVVMAWSNTLWVAYPMYVAVIGINQLLLCLIYVQCAKILSNQEFILLFSFNAAAGLLAQSAIQAAIEMLQMSITNQFYVYGGYSMALGMMFSFLCYLHYLRTGLKMLVPAEDGMSMLLT